ncbi:MAG TPA: acetate--CoA ligase family protein [Amycolatopsis sp.]|nr:acetate--CoA ligase family protein [Amycolatopsis sp.]
MTGLLPGSHDGAAAAQCLRGDAVPELPALDVAALRAFVADHRSDGDGWLSPPEAYRFIRLAGFRCVTTHYARDELDAIGVAGELAGRLAVKADTQGLEDESRDGGVLLGVYGAGGACDAYRVLKARFGPALRGVSVQPMVDCGRELLVGARRIPASGPRVVFGPIGDDTDRPERPAPRTVADADLLLDCSRSSRELWASGLDRAAVREVVLKLARLALVLPELSVVDLKPLAVHASGCVAVDVRVRLEGRADVDPLLGRLSG